MRLSLSIPEMSADAAAPQLQGIGRVEVPGVKKV